MLLKKKKSLIKGDYSPSTLEFQTRRSERRIWRGCGLARFARKVIIVHSSYRRVQREIYTWGCYSTMEDPRRERTLIHRTPLELPRGWFAPPETKHIVRI